MLTTPISTAAPRRVLGQTAGRLLLLQGWRRVPPRCAAGPGQTLLRFCLQLREAGPGSVVSPPPAPHVRSTWLDGLGVAVGPCLGLHVQWTELCIQTLRGAADGTASQLLSPSPGGLMPWGLAARARWEMARAGDGLAERLWGWTRRLLRAPRPSCAQERAQAPSPAPGGRLKQHPALHRGVCRKRPARKHVSITGRDEQHLGDGRRTRAPERK